MIQIRRSDRRGRTRLPWLDSSHAFSFADYQDPHNMGFGVLRVINEDRVRPGGGFPPHAHRDMEIISYVLGGALEHKDSLGTGSVIRAGDVQRMTAGTGIRHSEYNHSREHCVHFLQMWIVPEEPGLEPSYEQRTIPEPEKRNTLRLVASPDGREQSLTIHQDVELYLASIAAGRSVHHALEAKRGAWVQVAKGAVALDGYSLLAGDGAAISREDGVDLTASEPADVLLFDLPAVNGRG
jgi:redox-sensitive bicupin YhaK (pirin superfamily)